MDKNTKKEYKLKKLKYGYRKKSFDNLVVKRVKFDGKLTNKQQDLEILNAKEEYIKNNREMVSNGVPHMEEDRIGTKSTIVSTIIGCSAGLGVYAAYALNGGDVPSPASDIMLSLSMVGSTAIGAIAGSTFAKTPKFMRYIENKKLSANALKQRIATKQIENYETKIQALDETIKGKYEKVSDLVHDERYEELYNIKRQRNMESAAAFFRELDEESVIDSNNNQEAVETKSQTSELPKLNVRPYDPALDGVEAVATLDELNNGYDNGCVYEADNDFEA